MQLPHALPDELLFGRIMRYLALSGEDSRVFAERILRSGRHSVNPSLTSGLRNLGKLAKEDAKELLFKQSIAPIFMFYAPAHSRQIEDQLLDNDSNKALWISQLASFRTGHTCCLKWCSQCAENDIVRLGVSYWRRSHQIPGVSACYEHQQNLHVIPLNSRRKLVRGLYPSCESHSSKATEPELGLARFSSELLQLISLYRLFFNSAQAYRNKLDELGYITRCSQVRRQQLFYDFYQSIKSYPQYMDNPLPRNVKDYRYISELLLPMSCHHPFRHLLFGSWLFESAEEFLEYDRPRSKAIDTAKHDELDNRAVEKKCVELMRCGKSMEEVYRITGKSRSYLKRIAFKHAVPLNLKPRKLTDNLRSKILELAKLAMHRERISRICNIGVGSVEQVISSQSNLVEWRKQCHFESKRRRCRLRLRRYLSKEPKALRRDIKSDCNASFFWLYHNDREWLESTLPVASKPLGFGKYISG
ncbi:TnsD family Tn7-like transposition protein [Vibrio hangzhouensis]|uniref:TnsD family Tn7-like transposition protein n=1 Tax=Vibrio hangzhouensis TaxID=462991 RepID=UPI001C94A7ED|nr:TnsD family Tn7-like transposition protein [Vibrio hangzhouensis]MBY6199126.1 TnsD family transposase [Vibrio hangzhouensis]